MNFLTLKFIQIKKEADMKKSVIGSFVMAALLALTSCGAKETNEIKIGGIFPLSGAVAVYGVECKNGIDLAIEEINAAGGINGKNVVLISEDDEGNPDKTVNAYQKLTSKDGAKIVHRLRKLFRLLQLLQLPQLLMLEIIFSVHVLLIHSRVE